MILDLGIFRRLYLVDVLFPKNENDCCFNQQSWDLERALEETWAYKDITPWDAP